MPVFELISLSVQPSRERMARSKAPKVGGDDDTRFLSLAIDDLSDQDKVILIGYIDHSTGAGGMRQWLRGMRVLKAGGLVASSKQHSFSDTARTNKLRLFNPFPDFVVMTGNS